MASVARVFRGSLFLMSPAAVAKAAGPKPQPVSEEFCRFAGGAPKVKRTEAVRIVWDHIKAYDLQDPAKRTEIICDATLKSLFGGRDRVGIREIMGLLCPHFVKN